MECTLLVLYPTIIIKNGANPKSSYIKCRSIIEKDNKILFVYYKKLDVYSLPGGTLEVNETLEDCLIRETEEEVGLVVKPKRVITKIIEEFNDRYVTYYYTVEVLDKCKKKYTKLERDQEMTEKWLDKKNLNIFLESYLSMHKFETALHFRESKAIAVYLGKINVDKVFEIEAS